MSAHWSLGVLIGVPLFGLTLLGLIVAAILFLVVALRGDKGTSYRAARDVDPDALFLGLGSFVAALVLAALLASPIGYWPFKAEYHQWRPITGTVTQVSSRIISDGNQSVNQRFVVRFAEHGSFYGCDDTRCATVKVGDHLALSCKREWQYASVSGYGCRWLS